MIDFGPVAWLLLLEATKKKKRKILQIQTKMDKIKQNYEEMKKSITKLKSYLI
jgi:GTP-binding protein EngB required for normal cell division